MSRVIPNNRINNSAEQYSYLLNNTSEYLEIDDYGNDTINFHDDNGVCSKVKEKMIETKIRNYDKLSISHVPIVRDDKLKYTIYLETRVDSTLIYSMCFEELFFFDFDNKQFGLERVDIDMNDKNIWFNLDTVYGKAKNVIEKMTEYYKNKFNKLLYWRLYPTDNGVHAYCLSHKRNRRIQKHMKNLIKETVLACADPDWIAFSSVRFGFCTRISSKVKYDKDSNQKKISKNNTDALFNANRNNDEYYLPPRQRNNNLRMRNNNNNNNNNNNGNRNSNLTRINTTQEGFTFPRQGANQQQVIFGANNRSNFTFGQRPLPLGNIRNNNDGINPREEANQQQIIFGSQNRNSNFSFGQQQSQEDQFQPPQTGGATYNTTNNTTNNTTSNNAKNKVNKYNLKYLFDNIINLDNYKDIAAYVDINGNEEKAKINNQLMLQIKIKNLLVVLIRDVLTQHTAGLRIPIGLFNLHQCVPNDKVKKILDNALSNNTDNSYCDKIDTLTDCKISKLCKFVPLLDDRKLISFMKSIKKYHDKLRYSEESIRLLGNLYDKNNDTELSILINKDFNRGINYMNGVFISNESDKMKKKILNLPAGGVSNADIDNLNQDPVISYTPIMHLINNIKKEDDINQIIKLLETSYQNKKLKDLIDFKYEINYKYLVTPFILLLVEATKNIRKMPIYYPLIEYFLKNQIYKSDNTNLSYIFKIVIANDFSKKQDISNIIINYILSTKKNNTINNTKNSNSLKISTLKSYNGILANYVISHIFVHNNKNAFNKFVVNNKFLSNIKKKTNTNNSNEYESYLKVVYMVYIKILVEGLYYENKFFLEYFTDDNSVFKKHYENFKNIYDETKLFNTDKYNLSLIFNKMSKRFIIILFNLIKYNKHIEIDKDNLLNYVYLSEPILFKFNCFNNEALKNINNLDNNSKKNFFKFVMNVLDKDNLEYKLKQNYNSSKFFNFIIQMLKLYRNLENKFIDKNSFTNQYKFVWTKNDNIEKSKADFEKLEYINSIIIKLNKSIKSILSKSLKSGKSINSEIKNTNGQRTINYFATYLQTVLESDKDTNINKYNISTGVEVNAGGPTKAFFTDLSKELSKYINNLRKLKEDFPNIKNTNLLLSNNNSKFNNNLTNDKIINSNIYYLGKMTARLLFIEKYDVNLKFPDYIYNALIILLNSPKLILDNYKILEEKVIKNNTNVTKNVIKNINDYLLLDRDEIFRILNSSNDDFIMEFSYSGFESNNTRLTNNNGNVNSEKVEVFVKKSERNASELKQKLINFYEESKFIEDMYVILNNSNCRKFFRGFLEIYVKVLSKNNNFLINDLMYLTDKNTLKKSIENTVINTDDFINKLDFKYGNIPRNHSITRDRSLQINESFKNGIKEIVNNYDDNKRQDFFEDLLYFWTGSRVLPNGNLRIDFYTNSDIITLLNNVNQNNNISGYVNRNKYNLIPKSHTCFNSIDMISPNNDLDLNKYQSIITELFKFGFEEGIFGATSFGVA